MRIGLNIKNRGKIESNNRVSKSNYGSRPNYSIEMAILEKRLSHDNSKLQYEKTGYNMTDLEFCYDR